MLNTIFENVWDLFLTVEQCYNISYIFLNSCNYLELKMNN